jgi:hypothetical protein
VDARAACVHRILHRYLVEIVEAYNLCPWAFGARQQGEVAAGIVWGEAPTIEAWVAEASRLVVSPNARVIMVVAPELDDDARGLREIRDEVARHLPHLGIAHFHPDAALDLATPHRLVPFLRRSPDPLLQLVPHKILDAVRPPSTVVVDVADQAAMLRDLANLPKPHPVERIADDNHATVQAAVDELLARHAAIAADRAASYAALGISTSRRP